jgi:hypothetical protein
VRGIVVGLFNFGEPLREYERAFVLCDSDMVQDVHRAACYEEFSRNVRRFYPDEKREVLCQQFPSEYAPLCNARE